jgi:hypothetical protein
MEKTLTEAAQLLQKISRVAAMRIDWETRLAEESEYNSRKKCAEFSKDATPEVTKEEPIPKKKTCFGSGDLVVSTNTKLI